MSHSHVVVNPAGCVERSETQQSLAAKMRIPNLNGYISKLVFKRRPPCVRDIRFTAIT